MKNTDKVYWLTETVILGEGDAKVGVASWLLP